MQLFFFQSIYNKHLKDNQWLLINTQPYIVQVYRKITIYLK